ncbi:MAG: DUF6427 family protein [Chitinophagales bacterium]|nr:DUF6427 family protein [Chitinophagales bacterium]
MLSLFKNQQPFALVLLLLVLVVFRLPFFIFPLETNGEFYLHLGKWMGFGLSSILVFAQAIWLNYIITDYKLSEEKTVVPALIWILITSINKELYYVGDILIVSSLYLMILHLFIYTEERFVSVGRAFYIGILCAIIFFIHPQSILLIPVFLIIIYNKGIESIRTFFAFILGVAAMGFWTFSASYLFGFDLSWIKRFQDSFGLLFETYSALDLAKYILLIIPAMIGFTSFLMSSRSNLATIRKAFFVFVLFFIGAVIETIFSDDLSFSRHPLFLFPLSILIAEFLLIMHKKVWSEGIFSTFVVTIIAFIVLELKVLNF